jgi:hypothetical protein
MKSVSLLLLATLLVVPTVAMAWGNINAHPMINTEALAYFFAHEGSGGKYKYSPVDRTTVYTGTGVLEGGWGNAPNGPISKNITGWLAHGGYSADEPEVFASLRHFYDPLALNGGVSYLTDHIDEFYPSANPEMDAKTWGLDADDNLYCWKKGLQSYKYAMEKTDSREANLTFAYRALGETMHLFADMTQPAHVRNDSHPWAEPIEDNVTGAMVTASKGYPVDSRVSLAGLPGNLFDQLATFTNQYFYSNDTIFDGPSDTLPYNEWAHYPSPQFKDLTYDPKRCVYSGTFNGIPVPMIEQTASTYVLEKLGYGDPNYHVPPSYAPGLAGVLIPIAIHANAKMIDMFFPTINLTLTTTNIGNNQVRLEGQMTHDVAKDPAWQELGMGAIKYAGPGAVMTWSNGTASKVADVIFDKGVMTPIDINVPLSGGSSLYLQVTAGGRIFTSPEIEVGNVVVTISPENVTLNTGATQTFKATVTGTSNTNVTWSVLEGASGGTVSGSGVYTAPNTVGTYHVVATSQANPTKSATATITVNAQSGRFTSLDVSAAPGITTGTNCESEGAYLSNHEKFAPLVWTGNSFTANGEWETGTGTRLETHYTVSLSGTINADNTLSLTGTFTRREVYILGWWTNPSVERYRDISESTSTLTIDRLPKYLSNPDRWFMVGEAARPYLKGVSATYKVTRQFPDGTSELRKSCNMTDVNWAAGGYVQVYTNGTGQ